MFYSPCVLRKTARIASASLQRDVSNAATNAGVSQGPGGREWRKPAARTSPGRPATWDRPIGRDPCPARAQTASEILPGDTHETHEPVFIQLDPPQGIFLPLHHLSEQQPHQQTSSEPLRGLPLPLRSSVPSGKRAP